MAEASAVALTLAEEAGAAHSAGLGRADHLTPSGQCFLIHLELHRTCASGF